MLRVLQLVRTRSTLSEIAGGLCLALMGVTIAAAVLQGLLALGG
jgi:hypothetical protein